MVIAGFVWLRPGVKPAGMPSVLYAAGVALLLGVMIRYSGSLADRFAGMLASSPVRLLKSVIVVLAVLLLPMVLIPILTHWDVSGWMDSQSYDTFAMNILTGKIPQGSSGYMPLYQYGMALLYFVFGHFFFVQQLANALFSVVGLVALCAAAWTLFDSIGAVMIAGVLYIYTRQFFFAVHYTQIEAWYVPLVCIVLWAWARYWRAPSADRAAWLGAAVAAGLSTRNQGAFFFAWMCLAPLFVAGLAAGDRVKHAALVGAVLAALLLPWTIRNIIVDGRWSPFADRSAMYVAILTDPRIGLYGVRYWEGWDEVAREYQSRYPVTAERERAYLAGAWHNITANPGWLLRAIGWRSAAFYGVLPDGLTDLDRVRPTDWRAEWARYLFSRTTPLVLIPLSLFALVLRWSRTNIFLAVAIVASLAIVIASASPEDRISYPVLPMHVLLVAGVFADRIRRFDVAAPRVRWRAIGIACMIAVSMAVVARIVAGAPNEYRPLMARVASYDAAIRIDDALPLVNDAYGPGAPLVVGQPARARVMLSNYMYPPKFVGPVSFVPAFATAPGSPQYYAAYLITAGDSPQAGPAAGVLLDDARATEPLREGDAAEIEGIVQHSAPQTTSGVWLRATKIRRLPIAHERMPVFP